MNDTVGLFGLVIAGLWAIWLWTDGIFDYHIDNFTIDEDF